MNVNHKDYEYEAKYVNRLCEETILVHLADMRDIEIAKRQKWISEYPNDNQTIWEWD